MFRLMKFGQYELLEPIAIGGMAEVFKGRVVGAEGFEKYVAIKRILPDLVEDERFVKMLLTEARIHSALSHRNIVQIHDLGVSEGGEYFIVLEYVEGYDLRVIFDQLSAEGEIIPEALSLHIAAEIAQGLHFAHELRGPDGKPLGLVHRDVTPSNILISFAGEVKLSDFGLAKRTHDRSLVGSLKGNLAYMSPEQAMQAALDRRTDVFSLGAVLFELLTGRRLREITNEVAGWSQVASGVVPSVRVLRPDLPEPVIRLMDTALAADPAQRFPDAAAFGAALRGALTQMNLPVGASDLAALLSVIKPPRRSRSMLNMERSKVIRLGPDAAALREAAAAPKTPAPERRDPITTVGVPVPPVRLTPAGRPALGAPGLRPTNAAAGGPGQPRTPVPPTGQPRVNTPAPPGLARVTTPAPPAGPARPRVATPAIPSGPEPARVATPAPPAGPGRSRVATPAPGLGRPRVPTPAPPAGPSRPRVRTPALPTGLNSPFGGKPATRIQDPAATPPPPATTPPPPVVTPPPPAGSPPVAASPAFRAAVPSAPLATPPIDPSATPPPTTPLPPAQNRSQQRLTPAPGQPIVPQPQFVRTPAYGAEPTAIPPPGPPPGHAGPARPAGPPPGMSARRSSAGFPVVPALGPPGAPQLAPPRAQETARIQLRQRRSWAGVLFVFLLLLAGAAAAVHLLFAPLDVLITWREPAGLSIATDPRGAKVRLDGVELEGTAPLTISVRRDRANHIIEASLPGYHDARAIIRYDQTVALSSQLRLEKQPESPATVPPSAAADAGAADDKPSSDGPAP